MTKRLTDYIRQLDVGQSHSSLAREIFINDDKNVLAIRSLRRLIAIHRGIAEQLPNHQDFSHLPLPYTKGKKENVLVIADPHEPFTREGYMLFCREQQEKYECGTVMNIGDVLDNHYSSYHEPDPDGMAAGDELDQAIMNIQEWHYLFPGSYVCIGNHDDLVRRKLYSSGIASRWMKDMNEVLGTPTWKWAISHELNGVLYIHGTGTTGAQAALNRATNLGQSVVMGHVHTVASVQWHVTKELRIFGMMVSCGVDDRVYAMAYAKNFPAKYIVACGVVLEAGTIPFNLLMKL